MVDLWCDDAVVYLTHNTLPHFVPVSAIQYSCHEELCSSKQFLWVLLLAANLCYLTLIQEKPGEVNWCKHLAELSARTNYCIFRTKRHLVLHICTITSHTNKYTLSYYYPVTTRRSASPGTVSGLLSSLLVDIYMLYYIQWRARNKC